MLFNEMFYTKTVRCQYVSHQYVSHQYVSHQYVSHQSTHRKVKWPSATTNGSAKNRNSPVPQQLVHAATAKNTKVKWTSQAGNGTAYVGPQPYSFYSF